MSSSPSKPIEPWKVIDSTFPYRDEWLTLRSDTVMLPNGLTLSPYHTIECPDWINVIAISRADDIILLEEYRHGAKQTILQVPGGHVEADETPETTAKRELLEEAGYSGGRWYKLGTLFPVASRFTNQLHTFLALDVIKVASPTPAAGEIIRLREISWLEFVSGMHAGDRKSVV